MAHRDDRSGSVAEEPTTLMDEIKVIRKLLEDRGYTAVPEVLLGTNEPGRIWVVSLEIPMQGSQHIMAFEQEADAKVAAEKMNAASDRDDDGKYVVGFMKLHRCVPDHPAWRDFQKQPT